MCIVRLLSLSGGHGGLFLFVQTRDRERSDLSYTPALTESCLMCFCMQGGFAQGQHMYNMIDALASFGHHPDRELLGTACTLIELKSMTASVSTHFPPACHAQTLSSRLATGAAGPT